MSPALLWNWLQRWWLHSCNVDDLQYLKACAADGLIDSLSLRDFRRQIADRECRLMQLEADARWLRSRRAGVLS